ncbi:MAG: TRAP transporter substrate-binding protein [Oscillospiraceae bacterium]|nr:TRAP transporter substrate-binding protein [Oscillospiraceae bacterium]
MKKAIAILLALVMVFALCACGQTAPAATSAPAAETADAETADATADFEAQDVKMALVVNEGTPVADCSKAFAEAVKEKTGGKINIEVFAGGVLGTETELKEAVANGTVQMVNLGWSLLSNVFSYSMSYIGYYELSSRDELDAFFAGEEAQELYDAYEKATGVRVISSNWQQGNRDTIATRSFSSLDELKGLKIRTPAGVTLDLNAWTAWGAAPTGMALSEVYSAIEQGVIEAVECPLDYLWNYKFNEAGAKYLMLTEHQLYNNLVAVNTEWFDSLPEEYQQIIIDCANEAGLEQTKQVVENEANYIQMFKDAGVTVVEISDDVKAQLKELVAPINAEQREQCKAEVAKIMGG